MDEAAAALLNQLLGFTRLLRAAGLTVGTKRVLAYVKAVAVLEPRDLENLYWAGRITLVGRREDLAAYDGAFATYFRRDAPPPQPAARSVIRVAVEGRLPAAVLRDPGEASGRHTARDQQLVITAASPLERLRRKSFDAYTPDDHQEARRLIARLARRRPRRPSRRTRATPRRGLRPDLARTLRQALRTEGEPFRRTWRRRRAKQRRLVLVLDVSGSMGAYARGLARFAHAAIQAGRRHVDAFAFGTRLTRVTAALRSRDPDAALAALGRAVADWHGGTRIGESLAELIARWGRHGPVRGAVVVILSDGLERGDPELLARAMQRLACLAHRVVWVNPLKGSPAYRPLARGMAAALPHIDAFLPGHNLASLESLAEVVERFGAG